MVSVCPSCGFEAEDQFKFCPMCGSKITSDEKSRQEKFKFCPYRFHHLMNLLLVILSYL